MKNIDQLPETIFDLLTDKKYNDLSTDEATLVRSYMTETEYNEYYQIVHDFQAIDQQIPSALADEEFIEKPTALMTRIIHYKMPLYQVAAMMLLVVFSTIGLSKNNSSPISIDQTNLAIEAKDTTIATKIQVGKSLANDDYPSELIFNL